MKNRKHPLRLAFFSFLLVCLLTGLAGISRVPEQVMAAPPLQSATVDLALTMTVNNTAPNKTDNVIFTITVTNTSTTDAATGVTVQDLLPAGVVYVSDNSGGAYGSGTGIWNAGDIAAGGSVSLNITTNVTLAGTKTNTAQITGSTTTDPNPANNSASVSVTPSTYADLSLTLTVNNTAPNKTDPVIFTITVSNANASNAAATGVTVKDLLPTGLTYVSDSGAGTYNKTTGIWVVGTIPIGSSVTLNIITNATGLNPPTPYTITNTAEVLTSDLLDPNSIPGNSSTTEDDDDAKSLTPNESNISLTMSIVPPGTNTPSIGDIITFHIIVTNIAGLSPATGVKVTDLLPAGLTFISYTSSSGTYTSSTGNWSVGNLTNTTPKTLDITASVTNTASKTNVATVTDADQLDPDLNNNSVSIPLNSPSADLGVTMSVNNTAPNKADNVVFTITLTNSGPVTATGVTVKDLLPSGLTFSSYTSSAGTYTSGTGVWVLGTVPAGSTNTLKITTIPTGAGAKLNTVSILTSNQADTNTGNNSDSVTVTPKSADLSLTKKIDKNAPKPGDFVTFTLTLNNTAGSSTATNVMVYDLLPLGYTYVSNAGDGTYNSGTGIWNIGTVAPNTNKILTITAQTTNNPNKTNEAEVLASDQLDPDSTPNNGSISEDDDDAAPKVDLSLTQTASVAAPSVGTKVIFTLKVTNAGPAAATGVTVKDVVPANFTYQSDTGAGSYDNGTGIWIIGTLAVGETKTLQITVKGATLGSYSNVAEVWTSDQYDIDSVPGNNSTTEDDDAIVTGSISYPAMTIIINEVAWMGTAASTSDEWIELYNPGSTAMNLSGWTLKAVDGTPNIALTGTIPAGGFFLLERTDDTTVSDIPADQIYTGDLGNSYETLQLIDPLKRVIDTANSNGGLWPAGSSTTFGTMERRGVIVDSDTAWLTNTGVVAWGKDAGIPNDCTTTNPPCLTAPKTLKGTPKHVNWAVSAPAPTAVPSRTPTHRPTFTVVPPQPLVAINEFLPRPGHDWNNDGQINTGDEYIELINHGVINVNLSGYKLDDEANIGSSPFTLPAVTLKPGERIVFYGRDTGLNLSDGGDGVRLLKSNGQLVDAYNYTTVGYPDQAFCRLPDDGGADDWSDSCYPTPGLKNSRGSFGTVNSTPEPASLCPFIDIAPKDFVLAECDPFGNNIWRPSYWDDPGWLNGQDLPNANSKWETFGD